MTITRLRQAGAEFDSGSGGAAQGLEFDLVEWTFDVSATLPKTGTRHYASHFGAGHWIIPGTRQVRAACHFANTDTTPPSASDMFRVLDGSNNVLVSVRFVNSDLVLYVGGVVKATAFNIYKVSQYQHIGIDMKIDASAGWVYVYVDGVRVAWFDGNSGNANITQVLWSGMFGLMGGFTYFDDLYLDDTTGEAGPAIVPDRRFVCVYPNGNGNHSEATGQDANSTDNFQNVDDHSLHDEDATYNEATALDQRDTYAMTTTVIPAGWAVAAVIPVVTAKKTDAGADTQVALMLRENDTDWEGAAQTLGTSYANRWERRTLRPDGTAWTQAAIDALEAGFRGKGAF